MSVNESLFVSISNDFITSILNKYNPFGLTDNNGASHFYETHKDAYLAVMLLTYALFPAGYIELPLLLQKLYPKLEWSRCIAIADGFKTFDLSKIIILESYTSKEAAKFFSSLTAALCSINNTCFNQIYVIAALKMFTYRVEMDKKNEK